MLLKDFYTVDNFLAEGNSITASLAFNPAHDIFKGHFPGQPVVPGVCMVQMVKELLERAVSSPTRLASSSNIKFLSVIVPADGQAIQFTANYKTDGHALDVSAELQDQGKPLFRFKGNFTAGE